MLRGWSRPRVKGPQFAPACGDGRDGEETRQTHGQRDAEERRLLGFAMAAPARCACGHMCLLTAPCGCRSVCPRPPADATRLLPRQSVTHAERDEQKTNQRWDQNTGPPENFPPVWVKGTIPQGRQPGTQLGLSQGLQHGGGRRLPAPSLISPIYDEIFCAQEGIHRD
ncbi:unnamed protein product [Rangifer tarandus platyrhynchus]|uniref:Uncharacterized protein n=2 Tax=Rangifer tarandus platyrhynchus TaxID=3082113 RepID=A0ACB0FGD9_RANTA|nr:unnamed protein product [Rangifer tarandus platyrhynchus]CAI9711081.1 unnamed protein product [Rangifer tarandus platyrhynchus]